MHPQTSNFEKTRNVIFWLKFGQNESSLQIYYYSGSSFGEYFMQVESLLSFVVHFDGSISEVSLPLYEKAAI